MKGKLRLAALVMLSLGCTMTSVAEEVHYDSLSRWGNKEAVDGDPVIVDSINGWGGEDGPVQLTAGRKDTESVTIHEFTAGENSTTDIHGRHISFQARQDANPDNFYMEKSKLTVGDEGTEDISFDILYGGEGADITVTSKDSIHVKRDAKAINAGSRLTMKSDSIDIDGMLRTDSGSEDSYASLEGNSIAIKEGVFHQKGTMELKGADRIYVGSVERYNQKQSLYVQGGSFHAGGEDTETTFDGSVVFSYGNGRTEGILDGRRITVNAATLPEDYQDGNDKGRANAITAQDTDLTIGHSGTERIDINGNLWLGSSRIEIYGKEIQIHGVSGVRNYARPAAVETFQPVHMELGAKDTEITKIDGEFFAMPSPGIDEKDGNEIAIAGKNVILDNAGYDVMYALSPENMRIGSDFDGNTSDNTIIRGAIRVSGLPEDGHFGIHGKNIIWTDGTKVNSSTRSVEEEVTDTHDAFVVYHEGDDPHTSSHEGNMPFFIGDADSNVQIDGRIIVLNGNVDINGSHIYLYEGNNKNQYVAVVADGRINMGSDTTDVLHLGGGFRADTTKKEYPDGSLLRGNHIIIDAAEGHNAVLATNQKVTVGNKNTESIAIKGEVFSAGKTAPVYIKGKNIAITGKGEHDAPLYTAAGNIQVEGDNIFIDGRKADYAIAMGTPKEESGKKRKASFRSAVPSAAVESDKSRTITVGGDGSHGVILGNIWNDGTVNISFSGSDSVIDGDIDDEAMDSGSGGVFLDLKDGARWSSKGNSKVHTLNLKNGVLEMNYPAQVLTTRIMEGEGGHVIMKSTGEKDKNSRLEVKGEHRGKTAVTVEGKESLTADVLGSILVSVKDEKGSFYAPDKEALILFYHTDLGKYERSRGDKVTDGYDTDWYLKGITRSETDKNGNHTTTVRTLGGLRSVNYQIWRDGNDSLFERMGDLHAAGGEEGLWARSFGASSIRAEGHEFASAVTSHEYQAGWDILRNENESGKHYQGIALSYTRGKGSYFGGRSNVSGIGFGFYDTRIRHDGQYVDLAFKVTRLSGSLHGISDGETLDNYAFSAGAEYGWKGNLGKGWFIEPETQLTFGYMNGADLTLASGVRYEEDSIRSAVGRAGFRLGYEGEESQLFIKADWFHEFGGTGGLYLTSDEGNLSLDEDYGDSWFEYGMGMTAKLNEESVFYFDFEKGNKGRYHKKWSWNAGIRWMF